MEKRLLVVCDMFTPPAFLPRVRFFCDYLLQQGWQLDILTETPRESVELPYNIYSISTESSNVWLWRFRNIVSLFHDFKSATLYKAYAQQLSEKKYDAVFTSTFFSFPIPTAARIAKQQNLPLIVDLRDIPEQAPPFTYLEHHLNGAFGRWLMRLYTQINIRRRNMVLKQAAHVTSVSPWHVDFLKQWNPNTQLIYNGYDEQIFTPARVATEKFTISYTGKFYGMPLQDVSLLFDALSQLFNEQKVNADDFEINWYTDDSSARLIKQTINEESIANVFKFHSLVSHAQIPEILYRSSLALVLSNKAQKNGNHGIMTTKFFEALGCECPVLCVRSDEECLAQTIQETRIGIAAADIDACKEFILEKYEEWQRNGMTTSKVNIESKQRFARQAQAKRLEELLLQSTRQSK